MDLRMSARRHESGASLIEVALAIALIAIALVPTSRLWLASAQADQAAARKTEALVLAQRLLERHVRAQAFASLPLGAMAGRDAASGLDYVMEVSNAPALPSGVKRIEVRIFAPGQADAVIRMVTLAAKERW